MQNLVIVESPAKAKTIEKFLGQDYKVLSSYGHIRDLKKKTLSVNPKTFEPQYEIPADKARVVSQLKKAASEAQTVWLASDEDREGEAISWHLFEVLKLNADHTRRIVFHEITKTAIQEAILHPRGIDLNLVNAQQARRVLDRIVGFKLSPVLWRKIKPSLSAGRVQSVAVRLIVEREREIQHFVSEDYFRVTAVFTNAEGSEIKAELNHRFRTEEETQAFLEKCRQARFEVKELTVKPQRRVPAPPFTTSTLQQEAAHKLGFTVAQTMTVAQHLYENGHITYMRTDSVNLSNLCLGASRAVIEKQMGERYVKTRQYTTHSKGAQEAHEAIRPTYMDHTQIEGNSQETKLYNLIWKRTLATQMADAEIEKTQAIITIEGMEDYFVANGEVVKFDGFLKVYRETQEEDAAGEATGQLPPMQAGDALTYRQATATQRFMQCPFRYNEAALVKKLEELGIGRPSTYASTITTIQQREYVAKGDKEGVKRSYCVLTMPDCGPMKREEQTLMYGAERGKLQPTDMGVVVNDFLLEFFPDIMDYNFTADVEKEFDEIASGHREWTSVLKEFYAELDPLVEKSLSDNQQKVGERVLGTDPESGETVLAKIGRFGSYVQIGTAGSASKPRFAQLPATQSIERITLEEALRLFCLPRDLGMFEGATVTVNTGRFGPYVALAGQYVSVPKGTDPFEITLEQAVSLIENHRKQEAKRHLKQFEEDSDMEIMNGRYGAYITYKGTNYKLPSAMAKRAVQLTYEECMQVVKEAQAEATETTEKGTARKRAYTRKK